MTKEEASKEADRLIALAPNDQAYDEWHVAIWNRINDLIDYAWIEDWKEPDPNWKEPPRPEGVEP